MAEFLQILLRRLQVRERRKGIPTYRIPALWHRWTYSGRIRRIGDEIAVDPYDYTRACIEQVILTAMPGKNQSSKSLSQIVRRVRIADRSTAFDRKRSALRTLRRGGDWIRAGCIYGMMVRATTAWDHDADGDLSSPRFTESGTFLKTILLLPLLRHMGVNVIYLLPIARHSDLYRKGELGCPYSAKNFTQIEPRLHDRLLNRTPYGSGGLISRTPHVKDPPWQAKWGAGSGSDLADVNLEFGAFVEAAHRMGMRVMVDLAPRTAARDNDWILDHPEWFYWIDRRFEHRYAAPRIPGVTYHNPIPSRLHEIYSVPAVREHLAMFRHAPSVTEPQRWRNFRAAAKKRPPRDLVAAIGREFSVITPPGFSDCINDPQPPWSDVTYLRLHWDHPAAAVKHLFEPAKQPPYVLFDVAKASVCPGKRPNLPLWEALSNILPWYQRFGIDGARIDMGHALPPELERLILDKPRRIDPGFCFMAEELDVKKDAKLRRAGYNLFIGPSWWMEPRANEGELHKLVHQVLPKVRLPVLAAAETPDTPRAVTRRGGQRFARCTAVLNNFLPSAVPFINSGMECLERQPMNLGLDAKPRDRFALPKSDPFYGKLAFFDPYVLHWTNEGAEEMVELLANAAQLRQQYLADLIRPDRFFSPRIRTPHAGSRARRGTNRRGSRDTARRVLAIGVRLDRGRKSLIVTAILDSNSVNWTIS